MGEVRTLQALSLAPPPVSEVTMAPLAFIACAIAYIVGGRLYIRSIEAGGDPDFVNASWDTKLWVGIVWPWLLARDIWATKYRKKRN